MKKLLPFAITLFFAFNANSQSKNYASLKVKIANLEVDSLVIISYKNPNFKKVIKVDKDGIFKDTLNIRADKYYVSNCSNVFPNGIYLNNGYDLKITVDSKEPGKTIIFIGKGATENEFVTTFSKNEENFDYESLMQLDQSAFDKQTEQIRLNLFATLDKKKYASDFVVYQIGYLDNFIEMKTQAYKTILGERK
ncbi:hypothetical protein DOS84_12190 [Flavobacterium aquariorum]|uniref:DUF4369 domain-containing protein n=1 Tax=Flavobacterium aquariorum TaxID=2217670 RepID=A0A2W7UD69_9FLAO|nr:hypothetical protein [Flavobacterium aquariorum]PZX93117.1 hypothetical protein DOS84_12190 [Flavobacterium aquariorum]